MGSKLKNIFKKSFKETNNQCYEMPNKANTQYVHVQALNSLYNIILIPKLSMFIRKYNMISLSCTIPPPHPHKVMENILNKINIVPVILNIYKNTSHDTYVF